MKAVLVVEDERTYARIVTNWLAKNGMNTRYVLSISAAKEFILDQKIDLVLSDFYLPEGNYKQPTIKRKKKRKRRYGRQL